ncbi:MAG: carbohydrate ABC transporter permease, partial [Dehalococcoidia bacterium]|nr:carbohydrate ABC transporter permease [Dehalococcoidia bacterium]
FLISWNELLFALLLLNDQAKETVSLGLINYITEYSTYWGQMSAASVLVSLPVLVAFCFLAQRLVEGLTSGAVKG